MVHYLMSIGFFLIAFLVFVAVWAINNFAINFTLASSYYQQSLHMASAFGNIIGASTSPNNTTSALGIAMSLLF